MTSKRIPPGERVLIVDDTKKNYEKLRDYLQKEGFECEKRICLEDELRRALKISHQERRWFEIVFIDVDLSGSGSRLTGIDLYRSISSEFPFENYVLYTTTDVKELREEINRVLHRRVQFVLLDDLLTKENIKLHLARVIQRVDRKKVFLVRGRHHKKASQLSSLLASAFGLSVIDWETASNELPERRWAYEVVLRGMELSQATIILFTDDEIVELRADLRKPSDPENQTNYSFGARSQARANVYIEAGYAIGTRPGRTLFLVWPDNPGTFAMPSNFAGLHTIEFEDTPEKRDELRNKLEMARCSLQLALNWRTLTPP